ncbi:MAG: SAM-dependent methyltransferase [Acidimicrobiaceae bacterium]|nr:SAM-dependent methyltransferase [Acidimicrobiaceae bacterium]MYI54131.1 SAM-dependent methyltransferase [Acidimicrobiaceae bacterium]
MSSRIDFLDEALAAHVNAHSAGPDEVQRQLIEATAELGGWSVMQIGTAQGAFMTMLASLLQPRFAVEIGTFTGYSALCVAKALPPGGRLLCCDVSEEWTAIALDHWERAGLADRIELRIAPALDTLRSLPAEPAVDFAFIDADKESYIAYYEELVPRLSGRGVILVDNVLWSGNVANPDQTDSATRSRQPTRTRRGLQRRQPGPDRFGHPIPAAHSHTARAATSPTRTRPIRPPRICAPSMPTSSPTNGCWWRCCRWATVCR